MRYLAADGSELHRTSLPEAIVRHVGNLPVESAKLATVLISGTVRAETVPVDFAAGQNLPVELETDYTEFMPGFAAISFTLGFAPPARPDGDLIAEAAAAARSADVAIVVVGTTEEDESEGVDRATLALPGAQDALVAAVAAANPRTVAVVNAGAPVLMPWAEDVSAVLLTWFGGQEYGNALADVLTGAAEPGGRLPTTWRSVDADPTAVTPTDGRLDYTEDLAIGYRAEPEAVAFPFGHGLGYTTWSYLDADAEGSTVTVRLRDDGDRPGRETGQTVTAAIGLPDRAFETWTDAGWARTSATHVVHIGHSLTDERIVPRLP